MQTASVLAATGLLKRLFGPRAAEFRVEALPMEDGRRDVFEVETVQGTTVLRGSSGVSVASALHWFLKHHCFQLITWDNPSATLPDKLPRVTKTRITSPYRYRYYLNYVTFSYSTVWWDWDRWEREIDWMALHGINLPLALTGTEAVWYDLAQEAGLPDGAMQELFAGPAFLPFAWMGCVDNWGGPLPGAWIQQQKHLQQKILEREREFGMTPVLHGFSGHLPTALTTVFPDARYQTTQWTDFPQVHFIDPTDPTIAVVGSRYYQKLHALYGPSHYYSADPFIEMKPPSGSADYLEGCGRAIYQAMATADADAVWVLQSWPFTFNRWDPGQVRAVLGGVPDASAVVLDLFAESVPGWSAFDGFHRKAWIWCVLHNFGGRPGLAGNLSGIADGPPDQGDAEHLAGMGLTMESIEQNPVVYELATDRSWSADALVLDDWLWMYVRARYGSIPDAAWEAWRHLRRGLYRDVGHGWSQDGPNEVPNVAAERPLLVRHLRYPSGYDRASATLAWRSLYGCHEDLGPNASYRYDLIDLGRQCLNDRMADVHEALYVAVRDRDPAGFDRHAPAMLELLGDLDWLLQTDDRFALAPWIERAQRWGSNGEEVAYYEWNAKTLLTLWGPPETVLHDYASKHWAQLVGEFYVGRWKMALTFIGRAVQHGSAIDTPQLEADLRAWEVAWTESPWTPQVHVGPRDSIAVTGALLRKYT